MARRDEYLSNIRRKLGGFLCELSLENGVNRLNLNISAEDVFCGLLNILYDYELVNANRQRQNQQGIDLVDDGNRIAVQVTSANRKSKVQHTLEECGKGAPPQRICDRYETLMILILTDKDKFSGWEKISCDEMELRILGVRDLSAEIQNKPLKKLGEISDYLDQELGSLFDGGNSAKPVHLLPDALPVCAFCGGQP